MEVRIVKKRKIFTKWFFLLLFVFFLVIIPFLAATSWVNWAFASPSVNGESKRFVIQQEESIGSIATRLKQEGLIRDSNGFKLYLKVSCKGFSFWEPWTWLKKFPEADCLASKIQAGSFTLKTNQDLKSLTSSLTLGRQDSWTRVVEGLRNEEIATILAKNYPIKEEDFLKEANLGYMFPDTYLFSVNSTASALAEKMRLTFDKKVTAEFRSQMEAQGLSLAEGIILASIVERETRNTSERPIIAGILLKRLNEGWRLETDATVQFALGYDQESKTWWKKNLTGDDLTINSPYNTRRFGGLPPGPICNPGLSAIKAVANPVETNYYFYLHDKDGNAHFAATLAEHNANKAKYL